MAPTPAQASDRFYTLIFSIVLVHLKLNGKLIISGTHYTKLSEYTKVS